MMSKVFKPMLVYGVGINDMVGLKTPHYQRWTDMLKRCYSGSLVSYSGVEVVDQWKYLSNFSAWADGKNYNGLELDKDIMGSGDIYSPDTCAFVPHYINSLLLIRERGRGLYPLGVSSITNNKTNKFRARLKTDEGVSQFLGNYPCQQSAHKAWQEAKFNNIRKVANRYKFDIYFDKDVYESLKRISDRLEHEFINNLETKSLKGVV